MTIDLFMVIALLVVLFFPSVAIFALLIAVIRWLNRH